MLLVRSAVFAPHRADESKAAEVWRAAGWPTPDHRPRKPEREREIVLMRLRSIPIPNPDAGRARMRHLGWAYGDMPVYQITSRLARACRLRRIDNFGKGEGGN